MQHSSVLLGESSMEAVNPMASDEFSKEHFADLGFGRSLLNSDERQSIAYAILPLFPSLLSLIGSATIVYLIFREKQTNTYKRLVLGLTCFNVLQAISFPMQAFLVPKMYHSQWGIGNQKSCTALGFALKISLTGPLYNAMLSFYFLLTIRYGVSDDVMKRFYEPLMHAFAVGYPLVAAIVGLFIGSIVKTDVGSVCFLLLSETTLFVSALPVVLATLVILVNHTLIYLFVRATVYRSKLYSPEFTKDKGLDKNNSSGFFVQMVQRRGFLAHTFDKRVRAVANQGLMYVVASFLCNWPPAANMVIRRLAVWDGGWGEASFPYVFGLTVVLFPLQGFLNCLIYIRPTYMKVRKNFPEDTKLWALRRVVLGAQRVPPVATKSINSEKASSSGARAKKMSGVSSFVAESEQEQLAVTDGCGSNHTGAKNGTTALNLESFHEENEEHRQESTIVEADPDVLDVESNTVRESQSQGSVVAQDNPFAGLSFDHDMSASFAEECGPDPTVASNAEDHERAKRSVRSSATSEYYFGQALENSNSHRSDVNLPLSGTATHFRRPILSSRRKVISDDRLEEICSQVQHVWEAMEENVD